MAHGTSDVSRTVRVGVISDTHGKVPSGLERAFAGVDAILHAGDIERPQVLDVLGAIAPVTAVRGNCDTAGETSRLPHTARIAIGGVRFAVVHDERRLRAGAGTRVVVTGHTHIAKIDERDGVLRVNPGSAGNDGTVALVEVAGDRVTARIVSL
jgi:putative phosphoesterase